MRRSKKKIKLPGQPKKPMGAYFLWMNENRNKIKGENPGMSIGELGKKFGELWKALEDKSAEDKKRYEAENAKWLAEGGAEQLKAAKKAAKKEERAAKGGGGGGGGGKAKKKKESAGASGSTEPK